MKLTFISALVIAVFAVVFALQNTDVVVIDFLFWGFESSLALVLLLTFLLGALAGLLSVLSSKVRSFFKKKGKEGTGQGAQQTVDTTQSGTGQENHKTNVQ